MEMFDGQLRRQPMGPADNEKPDLELPPEDERAERNEDIVQSDDEDGGEFAAPKEPGCQDREQGLEAEEGGETEDDADRDAASDGVRGVANLRETVLETVILDGEELAEAAHLFEVSDPLAQWARYLSHAMGAGAREGLRANEVDGVWTGWTSGRFNA